LDKFEIEHEMSVPYTPQQNAKAERSMQTIIEAARTTAKIQQKFI